MNHQSDLEEAFRRAPATFPSSAAPRDGTPIVARDDCGEVRLIRWRTGADLDAGDEPYWALFTTEEPFEFDEWIPSPLSIDEILKIYG